MNKSINNNLHPSHHNLMPRINRIIGQVEGIKKMITEDRYCPDILMQLKATRSAIRNLELEILDGHLSGCVTKAFKSADLEEQRRKIDEIKELIKRFE